jgi:hypothetical protein
VPPAVALLNYISSVILWRIFCQTEIFAGFSLFSRKDQRSSDERGERGEDITLEPSGRVHPHTVIFRQFFLYIICRKDQRSCDRVGGGGGGVSGDIIFHSLGRKVNE